MGTSRTITHSPIVKGIPLSPPLDGYKNPLDPTSKLSSSSPSSSCSKLEFHPYAYIDFAVPTSFSHTPRTSMLDYSINPSCKSPNTTPPQSPTLPIPVNLTLTRPSKPSPMDSSQLSTTRRSFMPYSLRAYRTPTRPYRTASRTSNARLTVASSFPSIPSATRTTTVGSPHRSPSVEGTMLMPSGSNSTTTATSTSSSGRTSMRSPTPPTSSSIHRTRIQSLHCSLAGSATYSPAPLPPTMPYARQSLTLTTGTPSQKWSTTATTTITVNASAMSFARSSASSPSSMMPLLPLTTTWRQHKFLLLFLTLKDEPSPSPTQDIALLTSVAAAFALTMDQELHSRREGDVITSYQRFDIKAVGGQKCKNPGD